MLLFSISLDNLIILDVPQISQKTETKAEKVKSLGGGQTVMSSNDKNFINLKQPIIPE